MNLMFLFVLVASTPQESTVREELIRLTAPMCGEEIDERRRMLARISNAALEELPAMIKEAEGNRRLSLFSLYRQIAEWKEIPRTPAVILNLARGGTGPEHIAAAYVVLKIRDDRAIAFLLEGLAHLAAGERTESFALERAMLMAAGGSHSDEVGKKLLSLIDYPNVSTRWLVIDALGTLGYAPALPKLKELTAEKDKTIAGAANHAIQKLGVLSSPDLATALVEKVRGKWMSGEFSWYRWALEWIVHLKLTATAGALRIEYDEFAKTFGTPRDSLNWGAALLHAIHKLGGKIGPEELALLHEFGRLPDATPKAGVEEEIAKGFDKSVWAPRAQRLKEIEARNAPPPRIPEDKLPKFMKERIKFVMDLKEPDPSYLAPHAVLALETIEEMLETERGEKEVDKLLMAYSYLVSLREEWKTRPVFFRLAQDRRAAYSSRALEIVAIIADKEAESFFLEGLREWDGGSFTRFSAKLNSMKVRDAVLKLFKEKQSPVRESAIQALGDMGCAEALEDLRKLEARIPGPMQKQVIRLAIMKIETLSAPDHDRRLLEMMKSLRMSGEFSYYGWALDQIIRLQLKRLAPELRSWYDGRDNLKQSPVAPHSFRVRLIDAIRKLDGAITPEEGDILKQCGRRP